MIVDPCARAPSSRSSASNTSVSSLPALGRVVTVTSSSSNEHDSLPIASHGIRPVTAPTRTATNSIPVRASKSPVHAVTTFASSSTSSSLASPALASTLARPRSPSPPPSRTNRAIARDMKYSHIFRILARSRARASPPSPRRRNPRCRVTGASRSRRAFKFYASSARASPRARREPSRSTARRRLATAFARARVCRRDSMRRPNRNRR